LVDRSIILTLEPISDNARREEADIWDEFESEMPQLLGALYGAISEGLARFSSVHLERKPRMADFARWSAATAGPLGFSQKIFLARYASTRDSAMEDALEASALAVAVRALLEQQEIWQGTASELLVVLGDRVAQPIRQQRSWPKAPNRLSSELRRIAPALRSFGIHVDWSAHHRSRRVTIRYCRNSSLQSSQVSGGTDDETFRRDEPTRRNDVGGQRDDSRQPLERPIDAACDGRNDRDEYSSGHSEFVFRHGGAANPNATQGVVAEPGRVVPTKQRVGLI
jgi:hypothetical protein